MSDVAGDVNGVAMCDVGDVVWWICAVMCDMCDVAW